MLEKVKIMLGITEDSLDEKLQLIISSVEERLKLLLGGADTVPDALSHIVMEVSVTRFNRIGSEGTTSHTIEGQTMSFLENDFAAYEDEINAWLLNNQSDVLNAQKGGFRFL